MAKSNRKVLTRNQKRLIFYCLILAFPVLQFCIFYFYVNFNSLTMAFRKYDIIDNKLVSSFAGFSNFNRAFTILRESRSLITNSVIYYFVHLIMGTGLGTVFAYYIYKNFPLASFFKVILFIPNIVAIIILVTIYRYLCEDAYTALAGFFGNEGAVGLLSNEKTRYWAIVVFNIWIGFGGTMLLMLGSMGGINEAIIESGQVDGVNVVQEFIFIVIPMIFPTIITFVITGLSSIFVNQMNILSFYGANVTAPRDVQTFGYRFLIDVARGSYVESGVLEGGLSYPIISSVGLIFSLVTFILIMTVKKLLEKFGPGVD